MATTTKSWNTAELKEKGKANLLNSLSNLKQVQEHGPLVMTHGEGVYLWDSDGKQYMDAFAGLWNVNVGHGRHRAGQAMLEQIADVAFLPTFFGLADAADDRAGRASWRRCCPGRSTTSSSPPAARNRTRRRSRSRAITGRSKAKPDKIKIISRNMAYHGIAMGALAATGIPAYWQDFGPRPPGFIHVSAPYAYRNGEGLTEDEFVAKLVDELEETIAREGAETIAAMIGEPVQGAGGVVPPPHVLLAAHDREVLKKHDILLIADEVIMRLRAHRHDVRVTALRLPA